MKAMLLNKLHDLSQTREPVKWMEVMEKEIKSTANITRGAKVLRVG